MNRITSFALNTVLVAILLIAGGLLVMSRLPLPDRVEMKIVKSGSMEPAIGTGGIVLIQPSKNYGVGDVITFGEDTKTSIPTTHRIVSVREENGITYYSTKGDANKTPDTSEISSENVIGHVIFTTPYLGYLLAFAKEPRGFLLLIAAPAGLVILSELVTVFSESRKILLAKKQKRKKRETPLMDEYIEDGRETQVPARVVTQGNVMDLRRL
jgi:signal peptidase